MKRPELTESAKRIQKGVIQSIINRATDDGIKNAALNLQRLMIEKGMDIPEPKKLLSPEQKAYFESRISGEIPWDNDIRATLNFQRAKRV